MWLHQLSLLQTVGRQSHPCPPLFAVEQESNPRGPMGHAAGLQHGPGSRRPLSKLHSLSFPKCFPPQSCSWRKRERIGGRSGRAAWKAAAMLVRK